ncbi:MAG: DUF2203 domain-containing protein [Planctomycetota bacterium]
MSAPTIKPSRLFTLHQANSMLPLVRLITQDIVDLANGVRERKQRLEKLAKERPARGMEVYRDELEQTELDIDKDVERLQAFVDELLELGVELRSPLDGAVDFPSEVDGKPALLQWKLGDAAVSPSRDWDSHTTDRDA